MVSTRPPTSKSSSPFSNPLFTGPNAPITIGIIVTCMFHSFFNSQASLFLVDLYKFVSGPVEKGSRISNERYNPGIYSFDKISAIEFCLE